MVNAIQYEVMGPVTVMRDHRQLPELLIAHRVAQRPATPPPRRREA
jgi:hypothetical protein